MPLIKNNNLLEDKWQVVADDAALPERGPIILSKSRWLELRAQLKDKARPVGLLLKAGEGLQDLDFDVHKFDMIAVEFEAFTDGRGYSIARLLRGKFKFAGEIRAVGEVLEDQWLFLQRCGFNAFLIDGNADDVLARWQKVQEQFGFFYQASAPEEGAQPPVAYKRHAHLSWAY